MARFEVVLFSAQGNFNSFVNITTKFLCIFFILNMGCAQLSNKSGWHNVAKISREIELSFPEFKLELIHDHMRDKNFGRIFEGSQCTYRRIVVDTTTELGLFSYRFSGNHLSYEWYFFNYPDSIQFLTPYQTDSAAWNNDIRKFGAKQLFSNDSLNLELLKLLK